LLIPRQERLLLQKQIDVSNARQKVRVWSHELHFSIVDQTKLVTAASELARNTLIYGGGGTMLIEELQENGKKGIALTFEDQGPGIPDIELALKDGYTSGGGLGMGLGGAKRLVHQFEIESMIGRGTKIRVLRWQ